MAGEAVLSSVLREFVTKLSSGIQKELGPLLGVEKEKEKLGSNLSRIIAVLQDAEHRQVDNSAKDWLGKLKDVAYDAEDLLDEFAIEDRRREVEKKDGMGRKVCNFFSPLNPLSFRFKMAHKIQELRERLDALVKENNSFPLGIVVNNQPPISSERETYSAVDESEVCGRGYEKEELIDSLINSGNEEVLAVIPIVGMGGLGKTTLARLVYNHERVVTHFGLRMWVYVSQNFDVGKLLKDILQSAIKGSADQLSIDQLQTILGEELSGKRYLLVLDDVWNEDYHKWDKLRTVLKCGAVGSKILVTTRNETVATKMDALPWSDLKTLTKDESWTLFDKVAHPPPGFVSIGKEIVSKCGGLPLAIKTLGGMLVNETSEREWLSVKNSELWNEQDNDGGILPSLRLSYDNLTSSLKQCFAYCAVIPRGVPFNKDDLIKMWLAQGFIHSDKENELGEEKGESYFNALLRRSLFQADVENNYEELYKMHDLIHDLVRSVAGKECFIVEASMDTIPKETRHLALWDAALAREPKNLDALKKCEKLRSIITYGSVDINVCLSFRCLRVLNLRNRRIYCLPDSIDKLKHLRYLDVSRTLIEELPETICNLHSLQTLKLLHIPLKKLPKNMKRMLSLRHIEFDRVVDFPLPKGIGELTFLRTLPKFIVTKESGAGIQELKGLNQLWRTIGISGLDNIRDVGCAREANLKAKQHINSLGFCWSNDETAAAEGNAEEVIEILEPHSNLKELIIWTYMGLNFPTWMIKKLTNLVKISLRHCNRCEHLPPLGQLPSLESLEIMTMSAVKYIIEFDGSRNYKDLFPSLKYLILSKLPNLEGWSSPQEDGNGDEQGRERDKQVIFKRLRVLRMSDCPKLTRPPRLPLLPSIERLEIERMGWDMIEIPASQSLIKVKLDEMPKLERWAPHEADEDDQVIFRSFRTLKISDCPKLICLPQLFLPALEELEMNGVGCDMISFSKWSESLIKVKLINMPDLERLSPQEADEDDQAVFRSLRMLSLSECPKLICLPQLLLPALEELEMKGVGCDMISFSKWSESLIKVKLINMPDLERFSPQEADEDDQAVFRSLRMMSISGCPKLICLPQLLLPALEELEMKGVGCDMISFSTSKSLRRVELIDMPNLERWSSQEADDDDDDEQGVFPCLVKLVVRKCPRMVRLPHLLPALKELELYASSERLLGSMVNYTSLLMLWIHGLPEVEHLPKELGPNHASLNTLRISDCPKLISLSNQLENLIALKKLIVDGCNDLVLSLPNGLQQQQQQQRPPPLKSLELLEIANSCEKQTSLPGDGIVLPSLRQLRIDSCKNIESLSVDMLKNLTYLSIKGSPKVWSSLVSFENLKSLQNLTISGCPESVMMTLLESLRNLTSLAWLLIEKCPGMRSLPESVKTLTSLTRLWVFECLDMRSLPEWVGDLSLLEHLSIENCPDMRSLPEGLQRLRNLEHLWIIGCPVLERRVRRNKGQDWHKVAHVPDIWIPEASERRDNVGEENSDQCPHLSLKSLKKLPLPSCCSSSPSSSSPT